MLLESEEGKAIGLSYFEERGFSKATIEKFQLGYCLNTGSAFTQLALEKGYNQAYLENIGLTKSKEDRVFDFFKGRVMFPIHSISGRVLGFGGRTLLSDKKVAKYFNSPESIITKVKFSTASILLRETSLSTTNVYFARAIPMSLVCIRRAFKMWYPLQVPP
jgi:DNA primase